MSNLEIVRSTDPAARISGDESGMKTPPALSDPPAGNLSTGWLKIIALFFMLLDHLGAAVFPGAGALRILGRCAFPIYCWCMIVGFHYTRSVPRYLYRILLVGILSQPVYARVLNHLPANATDLWTRIFGNYPCVFFTLLLGLAGLWALREKKYYAHIWGPIAVICLATILNVDYGWKGILFIMLLYACRTSRPAIAAVMISYFLFWGTFYNVTYLVPLHRLDAGRLPEFWERVKTGPFVAETWEILFPAATINHLPSFISQPLSAFLRLETWGLLSLPFILYRSSKKLKLPTIVSYALYPAHLLLLGLIRLIIGK